MPYNINVKRNYLKNLLLSIEGKYRSDFLDSDPVGLVHELNNRRDTEIGGLFAAVLALGKVSIIRSKVREIFERFDWNLYKVIKNSSEKELIRRLSGFKHRFFIDRDFIGLTLNIKKIIKKEESLQSQWKPNLNFKDALTHFCRVLNEIQIGFQINPALIPIPDRGSACKRILMFLRWMTRPDDGIDFGLWKKIKPSQLIIPLDVHIFRISQLLGLTSMRTPSWNAAVEITENLKHIDALDPVRFDFALSRIGIVEGCRGKKSKICVECFLGKYCKAAN